MKLGDIVRYTNPSDTGEASFRFVVREINGDRVRMSEVGDTDIVPVPVETVHMDAITLAPSVAWITALIGHCLAAGDILCAMGGDVLDEIERAATALHAASPASISEACEVVAHEIACLRLPGESRTPISWTTFVRSLC